MFSIRTIAEPTVTDKPRCQYCGHEDAPQDPVKRYRVRLYDEQYEWRTECQWAIVCWARQDIQMFGSVTPAVEEALEQFRAELRKRKEAA